MLNENCRYKLQHHMGGENMVIKLMSDAFFENGSIPPRYTCDDENISPPLHWDTLPEHTISLAIICEDPDAPGGIFTHWIISNLTSNIMNLEAGIKREGILENGAVQGINDFGFPGYEGHAILEAQNTDLSLKSMPLIPP